MLENALEEIIKEEIRIAGPLTFARFMDLALYHPEFGYYGSGKAAIGREGDFYTSSHATDAYGRLMAEYAVELSGSIDGKFTFVEMGAGEGFFARDFADHLGRYHPGHGISYVIIENSDGMAAKQREKLGDYARNVTWYRTVDELPQPIDGVFFSNELLDAFPFHIVKQEEDVLREVYITLASGGLTNVLGTLSTGLIPRYFNRLQMTLSPGMTTEVNLNALDWMRGVANKLGRGYVITVDYGYPAREYYSPSRPNGTFLCYYRHKATDNPLEHIGDQDITAHVDFTSLAMVGKNEGLAPIIFTYQSPFLIRAATFLETTLSRAGAGQEEMAAVASGIRNLVHPDLLGSTFMVFVQSKGVPAEPVLDGVRNYIDRLV